MSAPTSLEKYADTDLTLKARLAGLDGPEITEILTKYGPQVLAIVTGLLNGGFARGWILATLAKVSPIAIEIAQDIVNGNASAKVGSTPKTGSIITIIQWLIQNAPQAITLFNTIMPLLPQIQQLIQEIISLFPAPAPTPTPPPVVVPPVVVNPIPQVP